MSRSKSRFNLLLLQDGEFLLDEYTAVAVVWVPEGDAYKREVKAKGKLRLCTRGVVFEPDDARTPIFRWPLRDTPGRPQALKDVKDVLSIAAEMHECAAAEGKPKDSFAFQPLVVVRAKAGGSAVPLDTRKYVDSKLRGSDTPEAVEPEASRGGKLVKSRGFFGSSSTVESSLGRPGKGGGSTPEPGGGGTPKVLDTGAFVEGGRATVLIVLLHTVLSAALPTLQQLWEIQQSCIDAASGKERARIAPIIDARLTGGFDASLLSDYREKMLLPSNPAFAVERVFPLVTVPGRLMVSGSAVYFMPVSVNTMTGSDPVQKWRVKDIVRVQRRSRLQRETGLEMRLAEDAAPATQAGTELAAAGVAPGSKYATRVFFSFASPAVRDKVYTTVLAVLRERGGGGVCGGPASADEEYDDAVGDYSPSKLTAMTGAWCSSALATFDYLTFLNDYAGRTHVDFSQYPVFPWVVADYTSEALDLSDPKSYRDLSKPVGALNEARLRGFRERYEQMPRGAEAEAEGYAPPFLYGTHYSTPGYVLYFLVRTLPEHMISLQAGKFDAPDRLFYDVSAAWGGVTGISSDLKELVPEFYDSDGAFLLLPDGLNLGVKQSGKRVGDVTLPPWAYDAGDFVSQCRDALDSDHVGKHVHAWIDLIFGCKQRGAAALEADNLFHHITYEGAVDVEAITDPDGRAAAQSQVAEFGQTPRQLFTGPHPQRREAGAFTPQAKVPAPADHLRAAPRAPHGATPAVVQQAREEGGAADGHAPSSLGDGAGEGGESGAPGGGALAVPAHVSSAVVKVTPVVLEGAAEDAAWSCSACTWLLGGASVPDRQSVTAGMMMVTSILVLGEEEEGQGGGRTVVVTTCSDGNVRVHHVGRAEAGCASRVVASCAPSQLRPSSTGVYRSASLAHAAITGRDGQLPLRASTALPGLKGCFVVAGLDGRVYGFRAPTGDAHGGEDQQHLLSPLFDAALSDAPILSLCAVPLTPSLRGATALLSVLLLAGTAEGVVVGLIVSTDGGVLPSSFAAGAPTALTKKTGQPITCLASKAGPSASWRVAVGDSFGRVWTLDVDAVAGEDVQRVKAEGRAGRVLVHPPHARGGSRAALVHIHERTPACESVCIEGVGRVEVGGGGYAPVASVSGVTALAWISLKQPEKGGAGGGEAERAGEETGEDEASSSSGSAPALLVTTSQGAVAVLYAPHPHSSGEEGQGVEEEEEDPEAVALTLCGMLSTGRVIRAAALVGCDGRGGLLMASSTAARGAEGRDPSTLAAWPLRPLLSASAAALLCGFQAGGVEHTVAASLSQADPEVSVVEVGLTPAVMGESAVAHTEGTGVVTACAAGADAAGRTVVLVGTGEGHLAVVCA